MAEGKFWTNLTENPLIVGLLCLTLGGIGTVLWTTTQATTTQRTQIVSLQKSLTDLEKEAAELRGRIQGIDSKYGSDIATLEESLKRIDSKISRVQTRLNDLAKEGG
jgi:uncharacterized protein HemX